MVVDLSFVRLYQCSMITMIERRSLPVEARPAKARPRPRGRRSRQRRVRTGATDIYIDLGRMAAAAYVQPINSQIYMYVGVVTINIVWSRCSCRM